MRRLRATVRSVTGRVTHLLDLSSVDSVEVAELPDPVAVELVEKGEAFYLLRLDGDGQCIADTWHATVEEAKAQANFEFDIREVDWKEVEARH